MEPKLIPLTKHSDLRGLFYELWSGDYFQPKQVNVSYSHQGVLRGIHAEPWDKYVHVVSGKTFAAIVNMESLEVRIFTLTPDEALFVPKGWGNSFQALEDTTYLYLCSEKWKEGVYPSLRYDDPRLGIQWPLSPILSEKDGSTEFGGILAPLLPANFPT